MKKYGFTVIELMISIAIIGILASLITITISNIKEKNRDTKRMSDMRGISSALNLYSTNARQYPVYSGNITGSDLMSVALESSDSMSKVPLDPLNRSPYLYIYESEDGSDFTLSFCLETNTINGYQKGCGNIIRP
jgi:prepilin-type N-terminal cleavage/methylation domain-containing protein